MSNKKKAYSLKPIRRDYTYAVSEIADMYKITPDTVFRWIRNEGLKRIAGSKKYFVHGSALIQFLGKRNTKNKKPCKDEEMFCCKCKIPRTPKQQTLKSKKLANKTIRVHGRCIAWMTEFTISLVMMSVSVI